MTYQEPGKLIHSPRLDLVSRLGYLLVTAELLSLHLQKSVQRMHLSIQQRLLNIYDVSRILMRTGVEYGKDPGLFGLLSLASLEKIMIR